MGDPDQPQQRFWMSFSDGNICSNIPKWHCRHHSLNKTRPWHRIDIV